MISSLPVNNSTADNQLTSYDSRIKMYVQKEVSIIFNLSIVTVKKVKLH